MSYQTTKRRSSAKYWISLLVIAALVIVMFLSDGPTNLFENLGKSADVNEYSQELYPTSVPESTIEAVAPTSTPPILVAPEPVEEASLAKSIMDTLILFGGAALVTVVTIVPLVWWIKRQERPATEVDSGSVSRQGITLPTVGSHETNPFTKPPSNPPVNSEYFYINDEIRVRKKKLFYFVESSMESGGPRLSITRWRKLGWTQPELEALLDMMAGAGIITPRQTGKMCAYLDMYDNPMTVLRKLSQIHLPSDVLSEEQQP